jgi:hypothetical protein
VGYPNIFPTKQSEAIHCGWLTRSERPAPVKLAKDLDAASAAAAREAGAQGVSTLRGLMDHEACTKDSWD